MRDEQSCFVVNVFTNSTDRERQRHEERENSMAYVEFCREVFRLRQEMKTGHLPEEKTNG